MTAPNLLTTLRTSSAAAMDAIRDIAARAGVEANVSVVVSHPGTVEDSFVIGLHEFAELRAILFRVEHGPRVECDVTSTGVGPETITPAQAAPDHFANVGKPIPGGTFADGVEAAACVAERYPSSEYAGIAKIRGIAAAIRALPGAGREDGK